MRIRFGWNDKVVQSQVPFRHIRILALKRQSIQGGWIAPEVHGSDTAILKAMIGKLALVKRLVGIDDSDGIIAECVILQT